ncbi:DUF3540 domain-containing protein [Marinibaculum pumilum]|uniref:DUF3540 domain-containing protein n=1 Tax=Marinibaculum pumilum TaxID=1766165 RepID=A0ABV7KXP3_9PROT
MTETRLAEAPRNSSPTGPARGTDMAGEHVFSAHVLGGTADPRRFHLACGADGAESEAGMAAGCLILPEPGDLVLCGACRDGTGTRVYILSVLVRAAADRPPVLSPAGGLHVDAAQGPLTLSAGTMVLEAATALQMKAATADMEAGAGTFRIASVMLESRAALARIGSLQLLGERLLSLVRSVSGRHQRATRTVEELDQLKAGEVAVNAERLITNQAHHIVHVSTEDMRFDGARIHMG